jgi:PKD repeat protein
VLPAPVALAQSVTVSPTSGDPGTALTVSGSGWTPADNIEVDIGGAQVCTVAAAGDGSITGDQSTNGCQVPTGIAPGSEALTAKDTTDQTTTASGSDFTVLSPTVSVSPTSGDPDAALTVSGTGWTPNDTIEVDIGGSQVCQLTADGSGNISGDQGTNGCQVPSSLSSGSQALTAQDLADQTAQATGSDFTVTPVASLQPPGSVVVGNPVSLDASGSQGTITKYLWDFGDGNTASTKTPTTSYTYSKVGSYVVTLTVVDSSGNTDSVAQTVTVTGPTASFLAPPEQAANTQLHLNGSGSSTNTPGATITNYDWNWGDSTPDGSGATPSHTYATPGTYTIMLTVTDSTGATSQPFSETVVVDSDQQPVASFTTTPSPGIVAPGAQVSFDGTGSSTPNAGATITSYSWNWGDGSPDTIGSSPTATHTYSTPATYTVMLTVIDTTGMTDSITQVVTVTTTPVAAFTPNAATVLAGSNVGFDGTGSSDPGGTISSYAWNFGDGSSATGSQPTHKYMNTGTFNVTLTVTDHFGKTSSVTHPITVIAPPPIQTLILTPVASPTVVRWSRVSATHSGHIDLGERTFCPGPGPGCTASILVTSRSLLDRVHAAHVNPRAIAAARSISIKPNGSAEVTFRLSERARAYLHKHHRLPVRVKITLTRGSQTTTSVLSLVFVSR